MVVVAHGVRAGVGGDVDDDARAPVRDGAVGLLGVRIALHQHLDPQRAQAIFAVLWCAVVLLMLVCECVRASRGLVAWTEAHSIGIVWGSGARAHTNRDPTRKFNH